ncbi:ABC transporter ATP-binding protein [Streptococcus sp.]|uniref:ABC transporter ATP-binding protein n=1 Tax=Streptococcus sp. TaxID=1306 RepID=UPI0035A0C2F4
MVSLFRYFRDYLKESILGPLFKLLEALFELIVPLVIAYIVDSIIPHGNQGDLVAMVLLLVGLASVGVAVAITAQYYSAKAAVGYTKSLSQDLYQKVLSLPKSSQDRLSTSSLLTRLSSDCLQIQTGINSFLRLFLRAPIVVFGAMLMAFSISPRLSIIFLIMVAILLVIVVLVSVFSARIFVQMRKSVDKLVSMVRENVLGARVIRAFGQKDREIQAFKKENQSYLNRQVKAGAWSASLAPLTYLVVNLSLIILIYQGKMAIHSNLLEQGQLIALINYLLQILIELVKMVMVMMTMNQTFISAKRVQEIFEQESEDIEADLPIERTNQASLLLEAEDVCFTYPESANLALDQLNFSVHAGNIFGIIGGTGSGKSSLVNLLLRLYPVSAGRLTLYVEGKSPNNLKAWRQQFALVPQKAQLFKGDVRSNLSLGLTNISDQEMWQALDIAQARDFLEAKEGLDSPVEAMGRNFSGGQRQRLTIARALLQPAPILILDDATSALDYLTESRLLEAIQTRLPDKTLIIVSQRIKSLRAAQQILVLDQGRQVGLGRHDELLISCPVYQEIAKSQEGQEVVE